MRTAARFAQHWNFVGGTVEDFKAKRDVLYRPLRRHRPRPARDPDLEPCPLRRGAGSNRAAAAALGEAGVELGIVQLRPPHTARVLEPLAESLAELV